MIVAPSVLSLDYANMKDQVEILNQSQATWLHFDVMDGHFVPNLSFGPDLLKGFKKITDLFLDTHIMVEDPEYFADVFMNAGSDSITFHYEALQDEAKIIQLAKHIRLQGKMAGLSIKPKTSVEVLKPFLKHFDLFLIMSVEPGFGGQSFIESTPQKIADLKKLIVENDSNALIEVDGGINEKTAKLCKEAGVDVLVAGSYVFKNDILKAVDSLV